MLLLGVLVAGCNSSDAPAEPAETTPTQAAAAVPSQTATPRAPRATPSTTASPSPTPTPEATATPEPRPTATVLEPTDAYIVTSTAAYAGPSSATGIVRQLAPLARVTVVGTAEGENWIIGDQNWVPVEQDWERTWYHLDDGSYVYTAFVYLPSRAGGMPSATTASVERYVIVDVSAQTAYAMEGSRVVREMPVTTGKDGFETPLGEFRVLGGGRIANERMTSLRAGIDAPGEQYDVERVLYTQYFLEGGFALHMNYWQPDGVYGGYPTSHGCVGFYLDDAQFLWMFGSAGMRVIVREGGGATPVAPAPPPGESLPAAPTPTPPADSVQIFAAQGAAPGGRAAVAARTASGVTCTLEVTGSDGVRREVAGVAAQTADAGGWLEWHFTIPPSEPPGTASVTVRCPGGADSAPLPVS